jgi:signal transduction histidine kinase
LRAKRNGFTGYSVTRARRLTATLTIVLGCAALVALIGYGDFREGDENSMLLFYMVPIAIATWYRGTALGLVMVVLSLAADLISDRVAGVPSAGLWNLTTSLLYYTVFVVLLSRWHGLVNHMHARVEERTAELQREVAVRRELEREVANVTEHERSRLGRELHDSLCQHLTGTVLKAQTLVKQVEEGGERAAPHAQEVVSLIDDGIKIARDIARGLFSSELEGEGLVSALKGLAKTTSQQHQIECDFHHSGDVKVPSQQATQLYWIAREAVANAVKHSGSAKIDIQLAGVGSQVELRVADDGDGIAQAPEKLNGIGLRVMKQRAEIAGGCLTTGNLPARGTLVRCIVPRHSNGNDESEN